MLEKKRKERPRREKKRKAKKRKEKKTKQKKTKERQRREKKGKEEKREEKKRSCLFVSSSYLLKSLTYTGMMAWAKLIFSVSICPCAALAFRGCPESTLWTKKELRIMGSLWQKRF